MPVHMKNIQYMDPNEFKSAFLLWDGPDLCPAHQCCFWLFFLTMIKIPLPAEVNHVFFFYDILHEYNIYILCCFIYCMPPLDLCWDKPRWMHGLFRCSSDETTLLVNANERHWRECDSSVGVLVLCMYISIFTLYHIALFICRTLAIGKCSSVITCDIKKYL